jgi:hypothetical protein
VEYPDASHIIVEPWLPVAYGTFPAQAGRWDRISLGGTAPGAAHASADSWPKILRFFENQLQTAR